MKVYRAAQIRNVALISHGGAGKTSLVDAALFDAGAVTRIGKVEDATSVSDTDADEIKRRMSINLTVIPVEWQETKLNLLDTPGYADFVGEVMAGLRVADAALVLVTAEKGVEVGTELVWRYADEHKLPRMVFINKLDRENTSFERALESLRSHFGQKVVPLQIPIGEQAGFSGVVDLITGKAYTFAGGKVSETDMPAGLADQAATYREQLTESAVESDDDLMAKYLEGEELSVDELRQAIRKGVATNGLVPVALGSVAKNIGIHTLLDALAEFLPSAAAAAPESAGASQVAFVFKTIVDPQKGVLTLFRTYNGTVKSDSHIYNVVTGTDERVGQVVSVRGKAQEPTSEVPAGDIGGVVKLSATHTGDTLGTKDATAKLEPIHFPRPAFTAAVAPKTRSDLDKLGTALGRITEEDPSLRVTRDPETAETLLAGMGESHVDIAIERMQSRYGVDVEKHDRRVPYRETIRKKARAEGRHKKQTGGHGQFGDVWLEIEPWTGDTPHLFENKSVGGVVPKEYVPGVEKGVAESLKEGFIAGCPMVHVRVALVDGKYHPVDSSSQAFETAAKLGMKEAVALASPTLLEPIMNVEIVVPDANMGDVNGDLNTKRARILGMEQAGSGLQRITAQVPMAEMLHYATDLRSITQGRGTFSMEVAQYEEVPANVQQQIIEEYKKRHDEK
ncbi:MAG TPA: elongation factor G [Ktedonobacterales bacterium]|nr:elongation factor G [Ktedonobacterales bacterium]